MPALKARVVTATGTRVRNVQVEVKPVIKKLAAAPARTTPPRVAAPRPTPSRVAAPKPTPSDGPPPMRPTKPRPQRRSTNPRFTRTNKTRR